jgi:hypothetical protein
MMVCRTTWILVLAISGLLRPAVAAEPPPLCIAYFVPSDREPLPGYQERLDRVMTEVQRFYREGMASAGHGPLTFRLEHNDQKQLRVYLVRGQHPVQTYGRNASDAVRREVKTALAKAGVSIDRQTLVIFQVLLRWDGNRAIEVGPYCGGGNHLAGTAWVYDDERLDPRRLASKAPGGYYGHPCSIGEFNSHYIGGVAHELGHAFGLPHDCQCAADRKRGTSLMGAGNHTYGNELRGEGAGTFLTPVSAMPLASVRAFAGDRENAQRPPKARLRDLQAKFEDGKIILTGAVAAEPPAYGIVAYNDPAQPPGDYDAVGWTCKVDSSGAFRLEIGELRAGAHQLRLHVCHSSGAGSTFSFDYQVDKQGRPNIDVFRYSLPLGEAVAAYAAGDKQRAMALARDLEQRFRDVAEPRAKAAHLQALLEPIALQPPAKVPAAVKSVSLSQLEFKAATVGWGRPLRDQVLVEQSGQCFLQVGARFFDSGLYAHAPAKYEFDLGGKWQRLRASFGLQDGHAGSVVFVVRGDGRELFRSQLVRDHRLRELSVDAAGLDRLELLVEDGGDGTSGDWGLWLAPRLER